jgi:hypothetical protein
MSDFASRLDISLDRVTLQNDPVGDAGDVSPKHGDVKAADDPVMPHADAPNPSDSKAPSDTADSFLEQENDNVTDAATGVSDESGDVAEDEQLSETDSDASQEEGRGADTMSDGAVSGVSTDQSGIDESSVVHESGHGMREAEQQRTVVTVTTVTTPTRSGRDDTSRRVATQVEAIERAHREAFHHAYIVPPKMASPVPRHTPLSKRYAVPQDSMHQSRRSSLVPSSGTSTPEKRRKIGDKADERLPTEKPYDTGRGLQGARGASGYSNDTRLSTNSSDYDESNWGEQEATRCGKRLEVVKDVWPLVACSILFIVKSVVQANL